jgi:hypothetical protein
VSGASSIVVARRLLAARDVPAMEVDQDPVYLGDTLRLHVSARVTLKALEIDLVCEEQTRHRSSGTITDTNQLLSREVMRAGLDVLATTPSADLEVPIPADLPPSFAAKHNEIAWYFRVHTVGPLFSNDAQIVFGVVPRPVA